MGDVSVIAAGDFDQRVTLQSRSTAKDAYGQDTITWTDVCAVWAQVQALRGREFFAAAQVQQEQTVKVRIRYRNETAECEMVRGDAIRARLDDLLLEALTGWLEPKNVEIVYQ